MRRALLLATTATVVVLAGTGSAYADGTDIVVATASVGTLTLAGGSASVPLPTASLPVGATSTAIPGSLMTVADLRGEVTPSGWNVTATYAAPPASLSLGGTLTTINPLGGANVYVSAASTLAGTGVNPTYLSTYTPLSSPVVVASAPSGSGGAGGTSTFTPSYKVSIPTTATVGQTFGATVTYTIASGPHTLG